MVAVPQPVGSGSSASLEDGEVVRRVVAGEIGLFEVLVRRYDGRVYRAVRSILRDEDEVEDAMQAAWVQAWRHLGELAAGAAFSTWVARIAANEALGRLRRARLGPVREAAPHDDEGSPREENVKDDGAEDPEQRAAAREAARMLERAVDRLPPAYRSVFMLREIEGLSTAETGDVLGLGEEAVKVRLHRARGMLREQLADEVGAAAPEAFQFLAPRCNRMVARVMAAISPPGAGAA
jgi:RNA polymerase sigma-70 factor (ECF subfamily)